MSLAFDTLAYARRMESVGFSRQQAEALADEQSKLIDERLATKTDIEALRLVTQKDIESVRTDIEAQRFATQKDIELVRKDIEVAKRDTIIALGTIVAIAVGVLSTLQHFWK